MPWHALMDWPPTNPTSFEASWSDLWRELLKHLCSADLFTLSCLSTSFHAFTWTHLIPSSGSTWLVFQNETQETIEKYLSRSPAFHCLSLSNCDHSELNLVSIFSRLTRVHKLMLPYYSPTIHPISHLTDLNRLDTGKLVKFDVLKLKTLPNLQILSTVCSRDSCLEPIGQLTKLDRLYLFGSKALDYELLSPLTNLHKLQISDDHQGTHDTGNLSFSFLETFTNLTTLSLNYYQPPACICLLTNLETLALSFTPVPDSLVIDFTKTLTKLRKLELTSRTVSTLNYVVQPGTITPRGTRYIPLLMNLTSLEIDPWILSPETFQKLRNLQSLVMYRKCVPEQFMEPLGTFTTLKKLDLYMPPRVIALKNLTNLTELKMKLKGAPEPKSTEIIASFTKLEFLSIWQTTLPPDDIWQLQTLTRLSRFSLDQDCDQTLEKLPSLPSLVNLQMMFSDVTPDGLSYLAKTQTNLRFLNLSYCTVNLSPESLRPLLLLKNLWKLDLDRCTGVTLYDWNHLKKTSGASLGLK